MANRRGMTLIEMLIAITVFSVVLGSALGFISRQSRALDQNSTDMGMLQNLSFAGTLLEQEIRTTGSNVPFKQPTVLYAGASTFIFNSDYASNTDSLYTVYYNPGLPTGQVNALLASQRFALPGTSPAFMYPDSNYFAEGQPGVNSSAETIAWFFQLDATTPDPNDYLLLRQVNDQPPEVVIRNVIQTPGRNFFRYHYKRIPSTGTSRATLDTVPVAWMPVRHVWAIHGAAADTAASARADSIAVVEASFTVTNGLTGTALRSRSINFMVPMPNVGTKKVTSCGDIPILGTTLNAAWVINNLATPPDTTMVLTWNQAVDEVGGESDVRTYVIWRRNVGAPTWGDPIASVPAGPVSPSFADETAVPLTIPGYEYALAAQDCTPTLSTTTTVTAPIVP
jgi:prepilin-type N-terminal cleavage/methylation domain-containing protein